MCQLLQVSKAAWIMKKAEEQLEKERFTRASAGLDSNWNGGAGKERVRSISLGRVLGGKLLVARMEQLDQDRLVLGNVEDRLYQLEDELQLPARDCNCLTHHQWYKPRKRVTTQVSFRQTRAVE